MPINLFGKTKKKQFIHFYKVSSIINLKPFVAFRVNLQIPLKRHKKCTGFRISSLIIRVSETGNPSAKMPSAQIRKVMNAFLLIGLLIILCMICWSIQVFEQGGSKILRFKLITHGASFGGIFDHEGMSKETTTAPVLSRNSQGRLLTPVLCFGCDASRGCHCYNNSL